MIKYEIHVRGQQNPYYAFESNYKFSDQERLFIKMEDVEISLVIIKITHDITRNNEHIVRLNCAFKKTQD